MLRQRPTGNWSITLKLLGSMTLTVLLSLLGT